MSKARKRYGKQKKAKSPETKTTSNDCHHIFFQRRCYTGALASLRSYAYCVVCIPKDSLHRQIHEAMAAVPTPKPANAREALQELRTLYHYGGISDHDDIEKRLKVLIALFDYIEQPTADALREQLFVVQKYKGSR